MSMLDFVGHDTWFDISCFAFAFVCHVSYFVLHIRFPGAEYSVLSSCFVTMLHVLVVLVNKTWCKY